MILQGHFRDGFPRITMALPAHNGLPVLVDFVVDTGFDGELALPASLIHRIDEYYDPANRAETNPVVVEVD